jgi:DNA-binding transcriptional regulator YhcF (GntR family)
MKLTIRELAQAGPVYQQVKNELEAMMSSNQLKAGDRLPRAGEIARANNIPEGEVVRAYHEMVLAGLLNKTQKKNLFGDTVVEHTIK